MDYLHSTLGIRCVAIAPGSFETPIWREKGHWMDGGEWIPLNEVVDGYMRCIEDESVKGGEVLEVLIGQTRIVGLGGEVPQGKGIGPVGVHWQAVQDGVIKHLKGEREGKL